MELGVSAFLLVCLVGGWVWMWEVLAGEMRGVWRGGECVEG